MMERKRWQFLNIRNVLLVTGKKDSCLVCIPSYIGRSSWDRSIDL